MVNISNQCAPYHSGDLADGNLCIQLMHWKSKKRNWNNASNTFLYFLPLLYFLMICLGKREKDNTGLGQGIKSYIILSSIFASSEKTQTQNEAGLYILQLLYHLKRKSAAQKRVYTTHKCIHLTGAFLSWIQRLFLTIDCLLPPCERHICRETFLIMRIFTGD